MSEQMTGLAKMKGNMRKFAQQYPQVVGDALVEELEQVELPESQRRIPFKSGAARDSGGVIGPAMQRGTIQAGITYPVDPLAANPDGVLVSQYIVPLHEDLEAFHPNGEAKFLESVMNESAQYLGQRVANRAQVDKVIL